MRKLGKKVYKSNISLQTFTDCPRWCKCTNCPCNYDVTRDITLHVNGPDYSNMVMSRKNNT